MKTNINRNMLSTCSSISTKTKLARKTVRRIIHNFITNRSVKELQNNRKSMVDNPNVVADLGFLCLAYRQAGEESDFVNKNLKTNVISIHILS